MYDSKGKGIAKGAVEGILAKVHSQTAKEVARQENDLGLYVLSRDVGCILLRCPGRESVDILW